MPNDLEIARAATFEPITDVAARAGIPEAALHLYGAHVAKVDPKLLLQPPADKKAKLILVTAINPTPAGEGKTTTTIGLGDALRQLGKNTVIALREPSLGPCFGTKGGATGGGYAQIIPMERINLHFTGDFHAIGAAHNLLSAMIDNHLYWGLEPKLDARKVDWRRVVDMNDRFLRQYAGGLGGSTNGFARETGFDITAASEIMAIFCLAKDMADLEARLSRIVIGTGADKKPVTAKEIEAVGAMLVLLKDALMPNLVQTLEGTPAFVHGGPFANIAHGCNSVIATKTALDLADYVVTESGFGADLGAEKFFDIKCRSAGLTPSVAVIVATARALKSHGGVKLPDLGKEDLGALKKGLANLGRHVENVKKFGLPVVVAINHFLSDTDAELALIETTCRSEFGAEAILCKHWSLGGKGAIALAERVLTLSEAGEEQFHPLYEDQLPLAEKIRTIVKEIYRGADIALDSKVKKQLADFEAMGFGHLPVCIAKTQYSFATDAAALGAPVDHIVPVREVRLSAGAGFVVAVCGDIMTMPGLSKRPAAKDMGLDQDGNIFGLF